MQYLSKVVGRGVKQVEKGSNAKTRKEEDGDGGLSTVGETWGVQRGVHFEHEGNCQLGMMLWVLVWSLQRHQAGKRRI